MQLSSKHKIDPNFNMSSMTDVVFLLLVFFMLTSNFVTPSAVPLKLPESRKTMITTQKVALSVSKNLEYFVDEEPVSLEQLKNKLRQKLSVTTSKDKTKDVIVIHADRDLPYEEVMKVAGLASELNVKVSLANQNK